MTLWPRGSRPDLPSPPGFMDAARTIRPPIEIASRGSLRRRAVRFTGLAVLLVAIFTVDYATGKQILFSIVYLIPISLAAWFVGTWPAVVIALGASVGWAFDHALNTSIYAQRPIYFWNVGAESAIFLAVCAIVSLIRTELERTRRLAAELSFAYGRLDRELRIVGEVQRSLLPERVPRVAGAHILTHYATSERSGGDYYDFFELPERRLGILIADAAGHGSPAAVLMAMMRILLHSTSRALRPPSRVLADVNADLVDNLPWGQFITACYAIYDPATRELVYALAGHNPPLVARRRSREVNEFVNRSGLPLGISSGTRFQGESLRLEEGDTVLFYTDGLTEAQNAAGVPLGAETVVERLRVYSDRPAGAVLEGILAGLSDHLGKSPLSDDTTLIVLQVTGAAPGADAISGAELQPRADKAAAPL